MQISVINDPFLADCVGNIVIGRVKALHSYWFAIVYFTHGNTKGEQRTPDCATFEEVITHLKSILDSVKNK